MIETPSITQSAAQLHACIRLTIPRSEIQLVMGPAIGEILAAATGQGIGPVGPIFSHHFKIEPGTFDFEICVPVRAPVMPVGRVYAGQLQAAKVARTVYHGGYEGLGQAWGEFKKWVEANGHTPRTDLWECYLKGPETGGAPSTWRTELNQPLAD